MKKTLTTSGLTLLGLSISLFTGLANAAIPSELKLDYAYYAPTSLDQNIPTTKHTGALQKAGRILTEEELVRKGTNVNQVVTQLFDARYAKKVVTK